MTKYILLTNYVDGTVRDRRELVLSSILPQITIGRSVECGYMVSGWGEQGLGISRIHCTIALSEGEVLLLKDGNGDRGSQWGTYWGRQRLDKGGQIEMLPEGEERVVIAIAPHQLTAIVSSDRLLPDTDTALETVRTDIYAAQLEMRVEELEGRVERLEQAIAGLQGCQKREY